MSVPFRSIFRLLTKETPTQKATIINTGLHMHAHWWKRSRMQHQNHPIENTGLSQAKLSRRQSMTLGAGFLFAFSAQALAQFAAQRNGVLALRATYGERGEEIPGDLVWRIYTTRGTDTQLVMKSDVAKPTLALPPGDYAVHVSHGLATSVRQISLGETAAVSTIVINAGALHVSGYLGIPERPLAPFRQRLALYIPTPSNSEGKLVTDNLRPGSALRLPEGTYHLVSTYTGTNSVVRTDVKIDTGKITEALVNHRAATMTLKLVRAIGGVALAGTQWTIETPGGDIIAEAVGAFPDIDIAEGSYNVLARHNERDYRGVMKVEGGINRDFELQVGE